ncbi:MAG: hypothetical protein NTY17_17700, partial [Planctomycetia bacterium]|nr:hypothetical protein [Planctomycetia bacterium]
PVGVEPTMADLQSAALATWLRSRSFPTSINRLPPISRIHATGDWGVWSSCTYRVDMTGFAAEHGYSDPA